MSDLGTLLDRLKGAQRDLILEAAKFAMLPPDSMLRRVADLENTIAAVEALMDEQAHKRGHADD
ncbi:hypothetical protein G3T14_13955 [Methylobacterium sp. BTF04]|uniref:hypothetical protein n=1 Tax=Methylobacterium sp. BTF04 TaxID=2708300 RepID=UPI0013D2FC87|nr:hypothetical protein [Methylobacterium sp. BTF04]NEU13228.1 hypothetical protein [Methylobacterium sp. BTF04]